jgi:protein-disulfide isomerase
MRILTFLMMAALATTLSAQPKPAAPPAAAKGLDKAAFEKYIRNLEQFSSQVELRISNPQDSPILTGFQEVTATLVYQGNSLLQKLYYVSKDGRHIIRGSAHDITKHPFERELGMLKTDLQPSFGTPGAKVVLVVFSDYQCPYCRQEAKDLREQLPKEFPNDVRVYFKDYPLTLIHPWSKSAAICGRCVFRQNPQAYWGFHDWIFDKQQEITADNLKSKVLEFAESKSLDTLQLTRCIDNRSTEAEVDKSMAEGLALGLDRTPTIFLNGRKLEGMPWQNLAQMIRLELEEIKTNPIAAGAAEKCCQITIPGMVK